MPFHVFLSHSSTDKPSVEELARRLAREGIQAWLDKWNLIPGDPWQPAIEKALAESETCAVFVGLSGFGPWQNEEMRAAIDQRVRDSGRRFRVIPVLLPGAERAERSSLPTFLAVPLPLDLLEAVPQPVVILVEVLLDKDPGRRFQNPAELLNAMPSHTRRYCHGAHNHSSEPAEDAPGHFARRNSQTANKTRTQEDFNSQIARYRR